MNRTQQLLALVPVMQAFIAGKTIQVRFSDQSNYWHDLTWEPVWDSPHYLYRVKPDLIEGYVNVYHPITGSSLGYQGAMYTTKEQAKQANHGAIRIAHVREIKE